jgi:aminoglycoside phosphotransferase (APT) family kinase protein
MTVDRETLAWAAQILGSRAATVRKGLREGGSPWLIEADGRQAVLRTGQPSQQEWFENEAAALRLAVTGGDVPVPEVYATGQKGKTPLMLLEYLEGSSRIPREPDAARLRTLGAVAARIHAIPPIPGMPERESPISETDFAQLHGQQGSTPLLDEAEAAIAEARPPEEPVFVHGDLWQGNTLWNNGTLTAVIDWDMSGAGPAGVDLGSLRIDAAFTFGSGAEDEILAGYEEVAGHAANVAYWDVVAGFATPSDMGWFPAAIGDQGRPDLDRLILTQRRDQFLRDALTRLG